MDGPDRGLIVKLSVLGVLLASGFAWFWGAGDSVAAGPDGVIQVRSAGELAAALNGAKGGERIRLAPGDYGVVKIHGRRFAKPVTIAGAAGGARPRFEALRVAGSSGLRLERLEIGADQPISDGAYVRIQDSQDVVLDQAHVHGSRDGNPQNDGIGVHLVGGSDIALSGSELEELQVGVMIKQVDRAKVAGNHIHTVQADGVIAAATEGLEVSGNYITNFRPRPGDHSDGIQLHNTRTERGTADAVISDNVIMQGSGERLQGIWISDGTVHRHRNITVANNLIYISDYYNGIGLAQVDGARVVNNTVVSQDDDKETAWIRMTDVTNATLERNVSDLLFPPNEVTGLVQTDNMFFSQRTSPRCLFPKLNAGPGATVADLVVAELGFQPGPRMHPLLRAQAPAQPLARAAAKKKCAGQYDAG
jgi:hypothetical protein